MSAVSWNIACALTNTSVPPTAVACFTGLPSTMFLTSSCLSGVTSPELLTNLIEFLPTYKSLKKFTLEPKLHLLVPSGIIEPVTNKATNSSPEVSSSIAVPEPEYIEPLMYTVPPNTDFLLTAKSPLAVIPPVISTPLLVVDNLILLL